MKNAVLAILAVALAAVGPSAMAAEGSGDNNADGNKQPTMAELGNKVDAIVRQLGSLTSTVGTLRTELGSQTGALAALSSTVTANHATIVGKFAPQMAIVMTVPRATSGAGNATYYLVCASKRPAVPLVGIGTSSGGFAL